MDLDHIPLSVTVLAEARDLLSALRRNRRFAYLLSFATTPSEHPLVHDLKSLRDVLRHPPVPASATSPAAPPVLALLVPPDTLLTALDPFFEVIRSRDASGLITGVALHSLDRIASRLIHLAAAANQLANYAAVLSAIVDATAASRFDATDPAADEVVLARIVRVLSIVLSSSALPLLADASILRAVEACLAIAAGRRRASDLLKRTADTALLDIFRALAVNADAISTATASVTTAPRLVLDDTPGPAFGRAFDPDAFAQHGPASAAILTALLELAARMTDPYYAQSASERALGLQLLSTYLSAGGTALSGHKPIRRVLLRDCARAVLRSLGLFKSPPHVISAAFSIALQLVHTLGEDAAPFLLALLERVYPYYISGFENILPKGSAEAVEVTTANGMNGADSNGTLKSNPAASGGLDVGAIEIDPVIREIGLESLAELLSIPGILCVVYRLSDCDLKHSDIVGPLLEALGQAAKSKSLRRRSKRLKASSSGTNRMAAAGDADSDGDDEAMGSGKGGSESARISRAASLLCADSVLAVIDAISDRLKLETAGLLNQSFMDEKALDVAKLVRKQKLQLQKAADVFNKPEKNWKASKLINLLREHDLIDNVNDMEGTVREDLDEDVRAIVRFIRETPDLSKEKIGNVLGEPDNLSRRVLADYTATFEFAERPFTESLRVYLESFRLPGEAQKIDRIVQSFANRYHAQNDSAENSSSSPPTDQQESKLQTSEVADTTEVAPVADVDDSAVGTEEAQPGQSEIRTKSVLKNADAVYVLSFSVVMLNTDQHHDSVKKKMTLDDFVKNCRGINDGQDLPRWFLAEIFDSIAELEIRMSDEAGIGGLTDLLWDEYLKETGAFDKKFPIPSDSRIFDEQIFLLAWESGVLAANAILNEAGDPNSVQKALEGFLSVARCATTYKTSRPTDAVISALCSATTLREGPLNGAVVRFGTDIKAQMASVALSGVSRQCGDWLRADGWQALVGYLLRLHALCLLPAELEQRVGGYGSELTGINKDTIPTSELIPGWWPSQADKDGATVTAQKPKKAPRPNGFFAAILAASIGSEIETDEEEDDDHHPQKRRPASSSLPHYLRTRSREDTEARDLARKCIAGCRIEDIVINEAKVLQSTALDHLCRAVSRSAVRLMETAVKNHSANPENDISEDAGTESSDLSSLWTEIAPPSPRYESSIIAGVVSSRNTGQLNDAEQDFPSFGLTQAWEGPLRERDERRAREFLIAFCIDVLCELTLQNRDRLQIPWPELHGLLVRIIAPATQSPAVVERAVVALLRVGVRMLHRDELRDDVLRGFNLLVRLPSEKSEQLALPIAVGIYNIVKGHGATITSTSGWHAILSILENLARCEVQARETGLETISLIIKEVRSPIAVSSETYAPLLDAILSYTSCSSVDTSIKALDMLYLLSDKVSSFLRAEPSLKSGTQRTGEARAENEVWSEFWGPLFLGFSSSVRDPRGKVRNSALGVMERVMASGSTSEFLTAKQWKQALTTVVLPLMGQLFSTGGYLSATVEAEKEAQKRIFEEKHASSRSNRGRARMFSSPEHDEQMLRSVMAACSRTRMRAALLTSKTFLQHHNAIAAGVSSDEFTELWISVLDVMRLAIESGSKMEEQSTLLNPSLERRNSDQDELREHVPETVKNMLLVMCDCGLLKREEHVRWNSTFTVVKKFIPDIEDIIIAATQEPVTPQRKAVTDTAAVAEDEANTGEQNGNVAAASTQEAKPVDTQPPRPVDVVPSQS